MEQKFRTATYGRGVAWRGGTLRAVMPCLCMLGVTPVACNTSEITLILFSYTVATFHTVLLDVGVVFM
jgi:hypothetical protein